MKFFTVIVKGIWSSYRKGIILVDAVFRPEAPIPTAAIAGTNGKYER